MNYKLSRYNICITSEENNEVYIFNTLTRMMVKVSKSIQTTKLDQLKPEDIKTLLLNGIIVHETTDEIEIMKAYMAVKKYEQRKLSMTIIPTNACNFRCVYCYQSEMTDFMNEDTVERILKWFERNLRFYNELNLSWFGGEPLLCSDVMLKLLNRIVELCKKYGIAMVSSVTTNGYLLDINLFQELLSKRVLYYQITVDGDEITHNEQRPHKTNRDSYSRILHNLSTIANLSNQRRFEIGVRINISGKMKKEDIYRFIDNMAEVFANDKRFVIIWQWVRNWGGSRINEHGIDNLVGTNKVYSEYIEYANKKGLHIADLLSTKTGTDSCEAFYKNGYVINWDGRIYKCAMCMEDDKNNCIGYIDEKGSMRIETIKEMKWLVQDAIPEKCTACVYLPICYTNRCHYSSKINGVINCLEYKSLIEPQIMRMIEKQKYSVVN